MSMLDTLNLQNVTCRLYLNLQKERNSILPTIHMNKDMDSPPESVQNRTKPCWPLGISWVRPLGTFDRPTSEIIHLCYLSCYVGDH